MRSFAVVDDRLNLSRRSALAAALALPVMACGETNIAPSQKRPVAPVQAKLPGDLVELTTIDSSIRLDIRYATTANFTGRQLYKQARAFLVRPAAAALVRAHHAAQAHGHGLTIYDAYRPWLITKALWDATPAGPKRNYVANPKRGSKHNRGCAIDLTLHSLDLGKEIPMPSGYDEFTHRAHRNFQDAPVQALHNRALLEQLMEAQGFRGASNEWWHFDFADWEKYPLLDIAFEEID